MSGNNCGCLKMSDKTLLKKVKSQMKSQFGKRARVSKVNKKCILCLCPYNQMNDIKNKKTASKKTKAVKGGKFKNRSRKNKNVNNKNINRNNQNKNNRNNQKRGTRRNTRKSGKSGNRVHKGGSGNCGIVGTQKPCGSIVNVGQYLRPASYLPLDGPNHHVKNNLD